MLLPLRGRGGREEPIFVKKEAGLLSYDPFSPRPFIKSLEMALGDFPAEEGGGSNPHLALGVTSQCISQGLGEKNGTERESTSGLLGAFVRFALAEEKRKKISYRALEIGGRQEPIQLAQTPESPYSSSLRTP